MFSSLSPSGQMIHLKRRRKQHRRRERWNGDKHKEERQETVFNCCRIVFLSLFTSSSSQQETCRPSDTLIISDDDDDEEYQNDISCREGVCLSHYSWRLANVNIRKRQNSRLCRRRTHAGEGRGACERGRHWDRTRKPPLSHCTLWKRVCVGRRKSCRICLDADSSSPKERMFTWKNE